MSELFTVNHTPKRADHERYLSGNLRIGTLNIQHSQPAEQPSETGLFDPISMSKPGAASLDVLAHHLALLDLDILVIQEIDAKRRTSGNIQQARMLSKKLAMTAFYAPTHGGYGLAILSRVPAVKWLRLELPRPKSPIHKDRAGKRGIKGWFFRICEPRACAYAVIELPGRIPLIVGNSHLDVLNNVARRQLQVAAGGFGRIQTALRYPAAAWLLMGDFNLHPHEVEEALGRKEAASLALRVPPEGVDQFEPLVAENTYPNWKPRSQIDHMLGTGLEVLSADVAHFPISDHAGLWANIALPAC